MCLLSHPKFDSKSLKFFVLNLFAQDWISLNTTYIHRELTITFGLYDRSVNLIDLLIAATGINGINFNRIYSVRLYLLTNAKLPNKRVNILLRSTLEKHLRISVFICIAICWMNPWFGCTLVQTRISKFVCSLMMNLFKNPNQFPMRFIWIWISMINYYWTSTIIWICVESIWRYSLMQKIKLSGIVWDSFFTNPNKFEAPKLFFKTSQKILQINGNYTRTN